MPEQEGANAGPGSDRPRCVVIPLFREPTVEEAAAIHQFTWTVGRGSLTEEDLRLVEADAQRGNDVGPCVTKLLIAEIRRLRDQVARFEPQYQTAVDLLESSQQREADLLLNHVPLADAKMAVAQAQAAMKERCAAFVESRPIATESTVVMGAAIRALD